MAWAGKVVGTGVGTHGQLDGDGAVTGTDTRGDAFLGVDRFREGGPEVGGIDLRHEGETEAIADVGLEGETDQTAAVDRHEIDGFGGNGIGGDGKVAFVLAVFVVDDDDHFAVAEIANRLLDWTEGGRGRHLYL